MYNKAPLQAKVIDLHNDLLAYLALSPSRTPDEESCGSAQQFRKGGVRYQVLPVFSATEHDSEKTIEVQLNCFSKLTELYPDDFSTSHTPGTIGLLWSIENVSAFLGEDEPIEVGIKRLETSCRRFGPPVYVSLTWNGENRCGGGPGINKGLTDDGRAIIEALDPAVSIDLSHTSDALACDLIEEGFRFLIASHSNFRSVIDAPRNLPDEIAQEIVARNGVIGLNVIKPFVGESEETFLDHIEYALMKGWGNALSLGSDFYSMTVIPEEHREKFKDHFFSSWKDPSSVQDIAAQVTSRFGEDVAHNIFWNNAWERLISPYLNRA